MSEQADFANRRKKDAKITTTVPFNVASGLYGHCGYLMKVSEMSSN